MIGILIATHGNLGKELIKSSELIMGKQSKLTSVGLFHGDSIEEFKATVENEIRNLEQGEGVLVFVDLYGGSPCNATAMIMRNFLENARFECITGVNLPMLLEALTARITSVNLNYIKEQCINAGLSSIKDLYKQLYPENNITENC
ncbi:PTS sugar transporter subunit IIA [Tepidanaerobacter syntrophicus]|uniref:PTS sugar transporter subunit IIA n=1 Tax=Tepidanaerobacter syntrophicus TaxID=224999 RepID=UPI001BD30817|nr:PTS sugar transporter subunit IIA [Tepidanaerobacter syntrophicus]